MKNATENSEIEKIIREYIEQNGIDCINDEEITDLFGESSLYPNLYQTMDGYPIRRISDYESYMLRIGINLIENPTFNIFEEYKDEILLTEDGYDLGDVELLSENDQMSDAMVEYNDEIIVKHNDTSVLSNAECINSRLNEVVDASIASLEASCDLNSTVEELRKTLDGNTKGSFNDDRIFLRNLKRAYEKLSKLTEDDLDYDTLNREIGGLERMERYRKVECDVSGDMWLLRDMLYDGMGQNDLEYTIYFDEFMIICKFQFNYIPPFQLRSTTQHKSN